MKRSVLALALILCFAITLLACTDPVDKGLKKTTPKLRNLTVNGREIKREALYSSLESRIDPSRLEKVRRDLSKKDLNASQLRSALEKHCSALAVKEAWEHCIYESLADQAIQTAGVKVNDKDLQARLSAEIEIYKEGSS
ncbi:MAG: hypothetical protein P1V97_37860, partial [Planctomycetota bacterium]|nr:hypothetical protein [Planctomycetota bacterium]